jgi:hypothetical protein
MRVTASNFRMQQTATLNTRFNRSSSKEEREEAWQNENVRYRAQIDEHRMIWDGQLRPIAFALKEELQRRVYGEPPYPSGESRMHAIESSMLAGPDPIGEAAVGLESLMRQLP